MKNIRGKTRTRADFSLNLDGIAHFVDLKEPFCLQDMKDMVSQEGCVAVWNIYILCTVLIFKNILFYYYNCYYLFIFLLLFFAALLIYFFLIFVFFFILYCRTPPLLFSFVYLFKGNVFKRVALRQRVNDLIDGFLKR